MSQMVSDLERPQLVTANSVATKGSITAVAFWPRLVSRNAWRTAMVAAGLLSAFAIVLTVIQFATPNLAGNDGYYHIRLAYLMRTEGLKPVFDWLPLTVLNPQEFVDHHFLYHVLLIPFTFGDLRLGAKVASVIFPALAFLAVWWLLRGQKVPYSGLWSLGLLIVSEAFIFRMSMPRAQSLSLGVLALALHWLLTARYQRLLPLAFLYVWLYNAFPLILIIAGAYVVACWLVERRLAWQALVYTGLGVGLGLLVNPYFPDNLLFIYRHIGPKAIDPTAVKVGSEWYPYKTTQLAENSGLGLVVFMAGVLALGLHSSRMGTAAATSLFVALMFGAMLFKSRRFVEYFPAFALIFGAIAWTPLIRGWLEGKTASSGPRQPRGRTGARLWSWVRGPINRGQILAGLMVVAVLIGLYLNLGPSRQSMQRSKPYQRFAGAAAWLGANSPPASRVFQTDWDDFPRLFYYNTHNTYTLGLDPTYMQLYDPGLYELWVDVSTGRVEQPSTPIGREFGAAYIVTDLKHEAFLREAAADPGLGEVYRDKDAVVFQVIQLGSTAE